jgi:hypothetical protein
MIEAFEEAHINIRKRGLAKLMLFAAREFTGLMKGLVLEHAAKWATQEAYITSRCASRRETGLPAEIVEVQVRLEHLLRSMEFAIAHHDFPKARFYSNEERITRVRLQRLVNEYPTKGDIFAGQL